VISGDIHPTIGPETELLAATGAPYDGHCRTALLGSDHGEHGASEQEAAGRTGRCCVDRAEQLLRERAKGGRRCVFRCPVHFEQPPRRWRRPRRPQWWPDRASEGPQVPL